MARRVSWLGPRPNTVLNLRFPVLLLNFDVLKIDVCHNSAPVRIYNAANLEKFDVLEQECLVAAFSTCTFDNNSRSCCSGSAEEQKQRYLNSDKTMEGFGVIYLECMKDSVGVLDVHGMLFLLQFVKH
jgi:hypothetical protein